MSPRLVILDLDGTVDRGGEPTLDAVDVINHLQDNGIIIRYLSNNSTIYFWKKAHELSQMGIRGVTPNQIVTSVTTTVNLVKQSNVTKAYVVGSPALKKTLYLNGVTVVEAEEALNGGAEAVIVGLDREATFAGLRAASRAIRDGALFIATNADKTFPVEDGKFDPGAGALVEFLRAASGRDPVIVGKPQPTMILDILRETGIPASEALMVGDRLDTDIAAGVAAGVRTWLVLTGVESVIPPGQEGSDDLRGLLSLWP